jgi:hypothetical protein
MHCVHTLGKHRLKVKLSGSSLFPCDGFDMRAFEKNLKLIYLNFSLYPAGAAAVGG